MSYDPSGSGPADTEKGTERKAAAPEAGLAREIRRRRKAAGLSQSELANAIGYSRQYVSRAERPTAGLASADLVRTIDVALGADGALAGLHTRLRDQRVARRRAGSADVVGEASAAIVAGPRGHRPEVPPAPVPPLPCAPSQPANGGAGGLPWPAQLPAPVQGERTRVEDLDQIRSYLDGIVLLDNQFGGTELSGMASRFFRWLRAQLGGGHCEPQARRDLFALTGELAEIAGWLAYDADKHDLVRTMNQESLYFSRLAGNVSIELLTLQNASMHAGFLGAPAEALALAESVLDGSYRLTPRLRCLFLVRKARALAQQGDESALRLIAEATALYSEGVRVDDPAWTWWIDERELAWHEAMCRKDLGDINGALPCFENSVELTATAQNRSRFLHRAYLLDAQCTARSWDAATRTMSELQPLALEVSSSRSARIIRESIGSTTSTVSNLPRRFHDESARLCAALDSAAVDVAS